MTENSFLWKAFGKLHNEGLAVYCLGDGVKGDERGEACVTYEGEEKYV